MDRNSAAQFAEQYVDEVMTTQEESVEIHYLDASGEEKVETIVGDDPFFFQDSDTGAFCAGCGEVSLLFPFDRIIYIKKKEKKVEKKKTSKRKPR